MHTYKYPRPMVTVDIFLLQKQKGVPHVLLIQRKRDPFAGNWALPGGFVDQDEALDKAAERELEEETGLREMPLKQLLAAGEPGRDPRGHTISIVYGAMLPDTAKIRPRAADDAADARWFALEKLPLLAFDHSELIRKCGDVLLPAS
ncbi:MAG: NUDIX hydrolase [Calditrichota bacterium]